MAVAAHAARCSYTKVHANMILSCVLEHVQQTIASEAYVQTRRYALLVCTCSRLGTCFKNKIGCSVNVHPCRD